jgi:PQQ-dependent dehydrogenase (methanol/ethanol family)
MLALDLNNNGAILWEFRPDVDREAALTACCGDQTRGLNYAEGKIFYNTADGQVFALDAETGEALWRSVGADVTIREHTMGNGIIIDDLYIIGNTGGEYGVRGKVSAFDIADGQTQWVMYSMGPDNEVGIGPRFDPFYDDDRAGSLNTWFGDSWRRGGGTVWGFFTYDPDINNFYYSTGNCGPWNPDYRREWGVINLDENGGMVDYRNNWCAGQMARDATTGELIWAYAITPADAWDIDEPLITPLVDLEIGGEMRQTAIKASRSGTFYVWDRANGELLTEPWHFVYVDIDHGVDMETGRKMYDITRWAFTNLEDRQRYTDYQMEGAAERDDYTGTEINSCPGNAARNWQNDAWSPQTGLLYTATDNSCFTQVVTEGEYAAGEGYTLRRGAGTYPGGGNRDILTGEPTEIAGQLQANDPVNSRTVWSVEWTVNNNVPVMATAGGLIFQGGSNAGVMRAFDAATGDLAWEFPLGSSFSASSTTYIGPDGRQYVAIIASASNTGQVNFDDDADDADRYRRGGATLFVFALPQSVAGGM